MHLNKLSVILLITFETIHILIIIRVRVRVSSTENRKLWCSGIEERHWSENISVIGNAMQGTTTLCGLSTPARM